MWNDADRAAEWGPLDDESYQQWLADTDQGVPENEEEPLTLDMAETDYTAPW